MSEKEDFVAEYRRREAEQRESASWHRLAGSATEFAGGVIVGALAGWGIDHWLDTTPWGLVVGTLVGFAAGMFALVKLAKDAFK
ncbi:MAG: AtpZ/AtpI family protein [Planctomycetota bacterium]